MLKDEDRIFTNLYADFSPWLEGAKKRNDWQGKNYFYKSRQRE